jgi:hypothetical protein
MQEFALSDDTVTVLGGALDAIFAAFGTYRSRGEKVMARHLGLATLELDPAGQYSCRATLECLKELQTQFGPGFLNRVGRLLHERVGFPPEIVDFGDALATVEQSYKANHPVGNDRIGGYRFVREGERRGRFYVDAPYPCAFDMGLFEGMAVAFGVDAKITHEHPEICRRDGGEVCTYFIEW